MRNFSTALPMMFRRSAAFFYDSLLLTALFFIITAIAIAFNDGNAIQHPAYYLFLFLIAFGFFDWFWRHGGQTLGMRAWRIKVEGLQGEKLSHKQSLLRYFVGSILFVITLIYMLFSKHGEALHDQLSKTKIVRYYN